MISQRQRLLLVVGGLLIAGYFLACNLATLGFARADNGDFVRLASYWLAKPQGFSSIWPASDEPGFERRFFTCWLRYWELQRPALEARPPSDVGTTSFFWVIAFGLHYLLAPGKVFDLLWLGWLLRAACLALLLTFYALVVSSLRGRSRVLSVVIAAPVFLFLSDPRATTFFNSFYREAGTLIYALLTVCGLLFLATAGQRWFRRAAFAAAAGGMLLAGSASSHFFTAFLVAGALVVCGYRRRSLDSRSLRLLIVALAATGLLAERLTDSNLRRNAAYHSLFTGVLLVSDRPVAHLAHLGLPREEGLERISHHAFLPESQRFIKENWLLLSHASTAKALLYEPVLIPRMLRRGADLVNPTVPGGALLLTADEKCHRDLEDLPFPWWTEVKARYLPKGLLLLALLAGGALVGLVSLRAPDPWVFAVGLTLAFASLSALGEIAVAVFGDGFGDLQRHVLAGSFFVDVTLALLIWRLALLRAGGTGVEGGAPHPHG